MVEGLNHLFPKEEGSRETGLKISYTPPKKASNTEGSVEYSIFYVLCREYSILALQELFYGI